MGKVEQRNIKIIKLNLLDGPKLIKRQVGISWTVFVISLVLIILMTATPVFALRLVNRSLAQRVDSLNKTYLTLIKKEKEFAHIIQKKNAVVNFIDSTYKWVYNQPHLSVVLEEIRKRMPKGSSIQGGINLNVKNNSVFLSLVIVSDQYIDAPLFLDSFGSSPYLYVKDAKVVPIDIASITKSKDKKWSYNVNLVLGWKSEVNKGDEQK